MTPDLDTSVTNEDCLYIGGFIIYTFEQTAPVKRYESAERIVRVLKPEIIAKLIEDEAFQEACPKPVFMMMKGYHEKYQPDFVRNLQWTTEQIILNRKGELNDHQLCMSLANRMVKPPESKIITLH